MRLICWKLCRYVSSFVLLLPACSVGHAQFISTVGSLVTGRVEHTATLLNSGEVLVAGGYQVYLSGGCSFPFPCPSPPGPLFMTELYNPQTETFSNAGNLQHDRSDHTATVLQNGKVLLTGGFDRGGQAISSAELYDPTTGTFTLTGSLNDPRGFHTATLLNDGTVLIAGGMYEDDFGAGETIRTTAEIYNATSGTFNYTSGRMLHERLFDTATPLASGMVLFAGGENLDAQTLNTAEL